MATRHRPHRGNSGPEIEIGDPFGQYEKQGGAQPGATESGDLQSREFGVPQADIPGGLNHLVNMPAEVKKPAHKGAQPADYHKYHGVPPIDEELYTFPPKADEVGKVPRPEREPKLDDAVPVVIQEKRGPTGRQIIKKLVTEGPQTITGPTSDPVRLADRDPNRVKFWISNESAPSITTPAQTMPGDSSAAAPAAGATITSLSLANGVYQVQWWFELTGTPGAADIDNVGLYVGATQIDQSVNTGTVGNYGPFQAQAVITGGPLTLATKAQGNATAGTTYKTKLVVTATIPPAGTAPALRIGDWETTADQRGLLIPAATIKDFLSQDSIFAFVATGVTVTISFGYETEIEAAE